MKKANLKNNMNSMFPFMKKEGIYVFVNAQEKNQEEYILFH